MPQARKQKTRDGAWLRREGGVRRGHGLGEGMLTGGKHGQRLSPAAIILAFPPSSNVCVVKEASAQQLAQVFQSRPLVALFSNL